MNPEPEDEFLRELAAALLLIPDEPPCCSLSPNFLHHHWGTQ